MDTTAGRGSAPPAPSASPGNEASALIQPPRKRRRTLALDLTLLAIVGVLLIAATAAAVGAIQTQFYSPSAFVERYLGMLSDGRAAEALTVPGVVVESAGDHEVRFHYWPRHFLRMLVTSGVAAMVSILVLVFALRPARAA